jgi:selenide,water dikinase
VDDPYTYGQIAAANALSDVYAMGGRPLTALNVLGVPEDKVPPDVIAKILRGGAHAAKRARCVILGGHTIRNPEPIYGMAVTGIVHPKRMLTNAAARPGDLLILTKPLGTGIAATAIKRGLASPHLTRRAIAIMRQLNTAGAELAEKGLVRGATDVTGFGLLGHLASMCRASGVGAQLVASEVPALSAEVHDLIAKSCIPGGTRTNLQAAREIATWNTTLDAAVFLLADAQTSGGLLLCVRPKHLDAVRTVLKKHRTPALAVIGHITKSSRPLIVVT